MAIDPVIGKTAAKISTPRADLGNLQPQKETPSKFDSLQDTKPKQADSSLPPPVTSLDGATRKRIESDLRKRLESSRSVSPQEFFKADVQKLKATVDQLRIGVERVPKQTGFDGIRQRFAEIDMQFQESGKLLGSLKRLDRPGDLLKVQLQMYQLTQNVELMSKAVEQVNSGVKQVLQTQI